MSHLQSKAQGNASSFSGMSNLEEVEAQQTGAAAPPRSEALSGHTAADGRREQHLHLVSSPHHAWFYSMQVVH